MQASHRLLKPVYRSAVTNKSIYLIAGEVSGDTHGAELIHALRNGSPGLQVYGTGGPEMRRSSDEQIRDWVEDAAVMGIWEVLKHYSWFKQQFADMLEEIKSLRPDALVLIDYPGFNLRMAKAVRLALPDTKIIYYISPQVWAWNKGRIPKMAAILDLMLCILPFEKKIFENSGLKTQFVGHPLVDELSAEKLSSGRQPNLVGLFPGSREREISRLFPLMLETAQRMLINDSALQFQAPAASDKSAKLMQQILLTQPALKDHVTISTGDSHRLMQQAACGVIASGTATLEAAWYGLPYCLVYRIAWPTYFLGKLLVKIDFIGLVNILAGRQVVEEFIQSDANPARIQEALEKFLNDPSFTAHMQSELAATAAKLGEPGCHHRAAQAILQTLNG